jgi:hypothetical protein
MNVLFSAVEHACGWRAGVPNEVLSSQIYLDSSYGPQHVLELRVHFVHASSSRRTTTVHHSTQFVGTLTHTVGPVHFWVLHLRHGTAPKQGLHQGQIRGGWACFSLPLLTHRGYRHIRITTSSWLCSDRMRAQCVPE